MIRTGKRRVRKEGGSDGFQAHYVIRHPKPVAGAPERTGKPLSGRRTTLGDMIDRALERFDARRV